jgi:hypothetical protein
MKTSPESQAVLVACILVMCCDDFLCHAEEPQIVNRAFIGNNFFLGLLPNSSDWVSIEGSSNLSEWVSVASVASTNSVTIIHDPDARVRPQRFYRLRRPGFSVADAQANWSKCVAGNYQFKLVHWRDFHTFTGTVTVTNSQKVITDAEMDGQPVQQPDPNDYPTIEELFALLQSTQLAGCRRVAAIYDLTCGYPTWCAVERTGQNPHEYRITDLTALSTEQAANPKECIAAEPADTPVEQARGTGVKPSG